MVSIWLGMLGEKSNAGLLEEEEANKHMICRSLPGTKCDWLHMSQMVRRSSETPESVVCMRLMISALL